MDIAQDSTTSPSKKSSSNNPPTWTADQIKQHVQNILDKREKDNAYGVSLIPAHVHNGTDSNQVAGESLTLMDVTTNDVSLLNHGFTPKAPNDTAKFLRGDGTWASIVTGGGVYSSPRNNLTGTLLSAGTTIYTDTSGVAGITTEIKVGNIIADTGYLRNLVIDPFANAITGASIVFTLYKNGSPTPVTVTIPASSTTVVSDTTHTISVAIGDRISLKADASASSTNAMTFNFSYEIGVQINSSGSFIPRYINGTLFDDTADIVNNFPEGFLINGKIVPSVASNNLTVAIKGLDGNDSSATNPVYIRIGDSVRSITAALSVTKNAGTNWCNAGGAELATQDVDFFVYLGYNATDGVVLGFSRFPTAIKYGDFSASSTNNKYAAISTITHAASTDVYENIGRFNATLSATSSFNWSIPATSIIINRPITFTRWLTWTISVTPNTGTYTLGTDDGTKYCIKENMLKLRVARGQGAVTGSPVRLLYNLVMDALFTTSELPGFNAGNVWDGAGGNIAALASSILSATQSNLYYLPGVWPNNYYLTISVDIPI